MGVGLGWRGLRVAAFACALSAASASAAQAATYYVNTPADSAAGSVANCASVKPTDIPSGPGSTCTLRAALTAAAAGGGANTIDFVVCGPYVITRQLPDIPGETKIDGSPIGTYDSGCTDVGAGSTNYGYANVEGRGASAGSPATFPGLVFDGAGSAMTFVAVNGFSEGIELGGQGGHHIYFDAIGANPFEQGALAPATTGDGVDVLPGSAGDTIGYSPADGNVAEGNDIYGNGGWGIRLEAGSGPTAINADYIGTDTSGHQFGPGSQGYGNGSTALAGNGPPDGNGAGRRLRRRVGR